MKIVFNRLYVLLTLPLSMACVAGVVMVALPISVISSTFQVSTCWTQVALKLMCYEQEKYAEHMEKQKIEVTFKIQCFTPWPPFYLLDPLFFVLTVLTDFNRGEQEARHLREKESYKKALPTWRLLFKMRGVTSSSFHA